MNSAAATQPGTVTLHRRRVYILPTRFGLTYAAMLVVMLIGATNYNNGLAFALAFLLASLGLVSLLHTYRNLAGLSIGVGRVKPAFCGENAEFTLCIDNDGGPPRSALLVRRGEGRKVVAEVNTLSVGADEVRYLPLRVRAPRRGWLALGAVTVATRYPLGLLRAWSPVRLTARALIYPCPLGSAVLPADGAPSTTEGARWVGEGEDFSGLRSYAPGDSPRRIHWKAVARGQGVPVKEFHGAAAAELQLAWEQTAGGVEQRLSQLTRWVLEAERLGYRYGLSIPGRVLRPASGDAHRQQCLAALALHGLSDG